MPTTIQMWGNSLGIRIPKAIAEQVAFADGTEIEFDTAGGVLTIRPARRRRTKFKLADLLKQYDGPSPHRNLDRDPPVGREIL